MTQVFFQVIPLRNPQTHSSSESSESDTIKFFFGFLMATGLSSSSGKKDTDPLLFLRSGDETPGELATTGAKMGEVAMARAKEWFGGEMKLFRSLRGTILLPGEVGGLGCMRLLSLGMYGELGMELATNDMEESTSLMGEPESLAPLNSESLSMISSSLLLALEWFDVRWLESLS